MPDEPAPVPPRSKEAGFYTWHSDRTLLLWLVGGGYGRAFVAGDPGQLPTGCALLE